MASWPGATLCDILVFSYSKTARHGPGACTNRGIFLTRFCSCLEMFSVVVLTVGGRPANVTLLQANGANGAIHPAGEKLV